MVKLLALAAVALATTAPAVKPGSSQYGRVLYDSRGFVLYAFTHDANGKSRCTGDCAKAWPPYVVKRAPKGALLGTTRRADGRLQVTYAGKPLYYYVGDRKPGQILCQNVREYGGLWLVVRPDGSYVR
jgi:predicted lipoprotein with Yx(FWY)xxD motif